MYYLLVCILYIAEILHNKTLKEIKILRKCTEKAKMFLTFLSLHLIYFNLYKIKL